MVIAKIAKICEHTKGLLDFKSESEIPVVAMSIVRLGCPLKKSKPPHRSAPEAYSELFAM